MNIDEANAIWAEGIKSHLMLGMRLDYVDWPDGVDRIIAKALVGGSAYCCVPDASQCVLSHDDLSHKAIVNSADLVLSDSQILQRTRALYHGVRPANTIKGADLMAQLCEAAANMDLPIALIGGKSDRTLSDLKGALHRRFPSLKIAYAFSPPFRPMSNAEDTDVVSSIEVSGAKLVFVGLGCPKQERWMADHKGRVNGMMIGVGAAFDFISGTVKPSPSWVHWAGLEWLYRLLSEPRRLWRRYLGTAPRFVWLILRDKISRKAY